MFERRKRRRRTPLNIEIDGNILRSLAVEWFLIQERLIPIGRPRIVRNEQSRDWEILLPDIGATPISISDVEAKTFVSAHAVSAYILRMQGDKFRLILFTGETEEEVARRCHDQLAKTLTQEVGDTRVMAMYAHYLEHGPGSLSKFL